MATQTHAITVAQYEQSFEGYITIGWQGSADRQALSRRFKQSGQCAHRTIQIGLRLRQGRKTGYGEN